jgi:iron complex outermembrane recepter protein
LRGAYAKTLGRPQTSNIIPGTTITAPDVAIPTITVSNTGLRPWTAHSFDLSLESYQIKGGVGSAGVFHKSISNFFSNTRTAVSPTTLAEFGLPNDPLLQGYEISTVTNGGDATVKGMEFSYRQSLTFLPVWARGVQVFANATRLQVDGSNSADFSGFNPTTFAGGVSLVRPRYFVKVTYNYQGEIRTGSAAVNAANGIPPNTSNYQGEKRRLGIDAQYSFHKRLSAYVTIVDVLGFEQWVKRYAPDTPGYARPSRLQELGYFTTIGIRGEF